jgi:chromate transporter
MPKLHPLPYRTLFIEFAKMALSGFGGVMPYARYALVSRLAWMSEAEFTQAVAVGQAMPGPNIVNVSLMFGYRQRGFSGAFACCAGLLLPALVFLLSMYSVYVRYSHLPVVQGGMKGILAVAAGLMLATGIKMGAALPKDARNLILAAAALLAAAWFRFPLWLILLVMVPVALAWAARDER